MFGSIGMPELVIILVIALIIFGPRKLPELGKSLGKSINEFKKASTELQNTLEQEIKLEEQKDERAKTATPPPPPPARGDSTPTARHGQPVVADAKSGSCSARGSRSVQERPPERGQPPSAVTTTTLDRARRRRGRPRRAARCRSSIISTSCASGSSTPSSPCWSASWSPSPSPSRHLQDFVMQPLLAMLPPGRPFIYTEPGEQFFLFIKIAAIARPADLRRRT